MWTYNSAKTLDKSLPSIERAFPSDAVCHKIAVDGGSRDNTAEALQSFGWVVYKSPRKGIPYQANYALEMVDSEFFASFEHDIILNPHWFGKTVSTIMADETVGCVQGIRLYTGSKTMQAIERWQYEKKLIPRWQYSVDNDMFRTEAVRRSGGFSDECMASSDGILRRSMFANGFKWITDYSLVSGHYRRNFIEQVRHQIRASELAKYTWSSNPEGTSRLRRTISMFGGNPRNTLRMAANTRMLRVPLAWTVLRFEKGLYASLPHEEKSVRRVSMDRWYLSEFKKDVLISAKSVIEISKNRCVICNRTSEFVYSIPPGWGNILPIAKQGTGKTFPACSAEHASEFAEETFRSAFECVTPGIGDLMKTAS